MNKITLPGAAWQWEFPLPRQEGTVFRAANGDAPAAEGRYENGALTCAFFFDFSPAPCILTASARPGDTAAVRYLEYRIELWINGALQDEEWPCGTILLSGADLAAEPPGGVFSPYTPPRTPQPPGPDAFTGAEGWRPSDGTWVGDCMPFSHDGVYHVFYLKDRRRHRSKWGKGAHQWAHISTRDLIHWNIHPLAVEIDSQEEGSICTGSVLFHSGRFYAFYSVRRVDGTPAPLCCSVSGDGIRFAKSAMNVHISGKYRRESVRDPKVFLGQDGLFHMFVTTSLCRGEDWQGCLAHLTSKDLERWHEERQPALLTEVYPRDYEQAWKLEPECSDYFYQNGWYYLISRSHYRMSRNPFGPWIQPADSRIPCGTVPKMALWQGSRVIFAGFLSDGGYGGVLTFREAAPKADGTLAFFPVREMEERRDME